MAAFVAKQMVGNKLSAVKGESTKAKAQNPPQIIQQFQTQHKKTKRKRGQGNE